MLANVTFLNRYSTQNELSQISKQKCAFCIANNDGISYKWHKGNTSVNWQKGTKPHLLEALSATFQNSSANLIDCTTPLTFNSVWRTILNLSQTFKISLETLQFDTPTMMLTIYIISISEPCTGESITACLNAMGNSPAALMHDMHLINIQTTGGFLRRRKKTCSRFSVNNHTILHHKAGTDVLVSSLTFYFLENCNVDGPLTKQHLIHTADI